MSQARVMRDQPRPIRWVLADAVVDRLPSDGYLQVVVGSLIVAAGVPWLGLPSWALTSVTALLLPAILISATVRALRVGTDRINDRFERRFWRDFEIASAFLAMAFVMSIPELRLDSPAFPLAARGLLLISYCAMLLASEMQPHREGFWRSEELERRLSILTVGGLGAGLFGYFAVIPALINSRLEETKAPIAFLFTVLTALLSARFATMGLSTDDLKWRSTYRVLAAATCCLMVFHWLRANEHAGVSSPFRPWQTLLWAAGLGLLITAVRLRHHPFPTDWKPATPDQPTIDPVVENRLGLDFRTLILALAVPLLHFMGYRAGIFSPTVEEVRELWMLFWAFGLGGLAYAQQNMTRGRLLSILTEQRRIRKTLAAGDRRLRMVNERRQTDEALYYSREKYAKAFRAGPYALAIMTRRDGRHLEANEQYLAMLGLESLDLSNIRFPDLLDDPDRWRELDRHMRRHGNVRGFDFHVRDRAGRQHEVSLSAESLRVDEEDCLVAIFLDLTRREDHRRNLRTQQDLLQACTDPAAVIDSTGRVIFVNGAAESSFAWSSDSPLGGTGFGALFEKGPELTAANLATKEGRNWMGRLPGWTADGSPCRLDCWWMPLDRGTRARQDRLILVVDDP